jgi:parallel beta-helix repeat protein
VKNVEIVNCDIENIQHGISIDYFSDNSVAVNNTINNYSADGCRLIGNNLLFAYNSISNCYDVDENHDDAIQSYSRGEDNSPGTGILSNVVIRGNLIIGTPDRQNQLAGNPQGIGCFDGFFDNWTIENNVVITDHYHGISFYGMRNGKIVNNTVIDQIPGNDTSPWILINSHKDGRESENCIVANNIVSSAVTVEGNTVEEYNNYIIGKNNYDLVYLFFLDPDQYDMHLPVNNATNANLIDKGVIFPDLISTKIDRDQNTRTSPPDLGAYEAQQ